MVRKIKKLVKRILAYFPTPLPMGIQAFDKWIADIIDLYGVVGIPERDIKFAVAVMVMHLDPTTSSKPKVYFGRALHKAMANQAVSQIINDIKEAQEAARKAAITPPEQAPTNGQK